MMNVCINCGTYRADKVIEPRGPFAVCPECGHKHPFLQLPLLIIAGASGTGKSTVCWHLVGQLPEVVILDADILWRAEFDRPADKYRDFFETWLRVCKNISQSGRPVVLFCTGGIPENVEPCVERRYFSDVHYLGLTGDAQDLVARWRGRLAWRQCSDEAFIHAHLEFNQWFKDMGAQVKPAIELLDTTGSSIEETVERVATWIHEQLGV